MAHKQDETSDVVSLPAIERKDLQAVLEKYGLLRRFVDGSLLCSSCSVALNKLNAGAFLVCSGSLVAFCDSPDCIEAAVKGCVK